MPRPQKYPEGSTASMRVAASTAALKAAGGARKTFRLSPDAKNALDALVSRSPHATETEIIERLLLAAARS